MDVRPRSRSLSRLEVLCLGPERRPLEFGRAHGVRGVSELRGHSLRGMGFALVQDGPNPSALIAHIAGCYATRLVRNNACHNCRGTRIASCVRLSRKRKRLDRRADLRWVLRDLRRIAPGLKGSA